MDLCFSFLQDFINYCWGYIPPSFLVAHTRKDVPHCRHERCTFMGHVRCTYLTFFYHPNRQDGISGVFVSTFSEVELVYGKDTGFKQDRVLSFQKEQYPAVRLLFESFVTLHPELRCVGLRVIVARIIYRTKSETDA